MAISSASTARCQELFSYFGYLSNFFKFAAFAGFEQRINNPHIGDRIFNTPDQLFLFADNAAEAFGLQLILVGHGERMPLAFVHAHTLHEQGDWACRVGH